MIKSTAVAYKFALERGLISLREVEVWADSLVEEFGDKLDEWLVDLSYDSTLGVRDALIALDRVPGEWTPDEVWQILKPIVLEKYPGGVVPEEEMLPLSVDIEDLVGRRIKDLTDPIPSPLTVKRYELSKVSERGLAYYDEFYDNKGEPCLRIDYNSDGLIIELIKFNPGNCLSRLATEFYAVNVSLLRWSGYDW